MAFTLGSGGRHDKTAVLDIEHSLRWHDPGRFNGYVLSRHLAGTPVDAVNLRDAPWGVKERAASPASGALRTLALLLRSLMLATMEQIGGTTDEGSRLRPSPRV